MKKDKLYTVNRFNRAMFKPNENLFAGPFGNSQMQIGGYNPLANLNPQQMAQLKAFNLSADMTPKLTTSSLGLGTLGNAGGMGSLSATNPTEFFGLDSGAGAAAGAGKGLLGGIGSSLGNAALSAGTGLVGSLANNAISGGLESDAGSAISNIGGTIGGAIGSVNPVMGAAVSVGSQLLGGLANRAFGSKLNQGNINKVENTISGLTSSANALGNASTAEDLLSSWGNTDMGFDFNNSFIGKDGWFSSKAKRKAKELRRRQNEARGLAINALGTGVENVDEMQDANILANTIAFGGNLFDFGGDLQTNSSDYSVGKVYDVSNEEANRLKAMGYEFEYIN